MTPHRVVAVHRGRVLLDDGRLVPVRRTLPTEVLVGDLVSADAAVDAVAPRRSELPGVANADVALIVTSLDRDLNARRLERHVAVARGGGVEPVVVLSKADLAGDPLAGLAAVPGGVRAIVVSALMGTGMAALHDVLRPGALAAMAGTSGAGKSTLANALLGEERMLTRATRARDGRGRHTTTHRQLLELPNGALLVDTPGVRLVGMTAGADVEFPDVERFARDCRFADCRHGAEPDCAVRAAIVRGELDPARLRQSQRLTAEAREARDRAHRRMQRRRRMDRGRD